MKLGFVLLKELFVYRLKMILAINQAEGKKIQDGLILYKPCDEIAVCDSLLTGEQTDQDKYSYKLLEA